MGDFYALFIISNVMNCGENQETGKKPTKSERIKKNTSICRFENVTVDHSIVRFAIVTH